MNTIWLPMKLFCTKQSANMSVAAAFSPPPLLLSWNQSTIICPTPESLKTSFIWSVTLDQIYLGTEEEWTFVGWLFLKGGWGLPSNAQGPRDWTGGRPWWYGAFQMLWGKDLLVVFGASRAIHLESYVVLGIEVGAATNKTNTSTPIWSIYAPTYLYSKDITAICQDGRRAQREENLPTSIKNIFLRVQLIFPWHLSVFRTFSVTREFKIKAKQNLSFLPKSLFFVFFMPWRNQQKCFC